MKMRTFSQLLTFKFDEVTKLKALKRLNFMIPSYLVIFPFEIKVQFKNTKIKFCWGKLVQR